MKSFKTHILLLALLLAALPARSQCTYTNTAFSPGEFLSYNLYFNWKFVWVKAGTASMSIVQSQYRGQQAYRASLITRSSQKVDNMFVMRDTLLCYNTLNLAPLYFRKGAREGKRYTVDEVFYKYYDGKCHVTHHRQHNSGRQTWERKSYESCIYDMMSIFLRARSFNPEGWKEGHDVVFTIADGDGVTPAKLHYRGKTMVKADNGKKYNCLTLSYLEYEKGKYREIARFFVTDDVKHIPVRLDMFLKFGSAKAFLSSMKL